MRNIWADQGVESVGGNSMERGDRTIHIGYPEAAGNIPLGKSQLVTRLPSGDVFEWQNKELWVLFAGSFSLSVWRADL